MQPPGDVLDLFGIRVIQPLGGRLNQHWLVHGQGEQLVLRRWDKSECDIEFELRLLKDIAAMGWPVAPAVGEPVESGGWIWSLFPFLAGSPPSLEDPIAEQRARGRLMAEFHVALAQLGDHGQRKGWRRCEAILGDMDLDCVLAEHEHERPEEVRILRWHLDRSRERIATLTLHSLPGTIIHGDFTAWNLRYSGGRLSGILDFELAHYDHRVGEFALCVSLIFRADGLHIARIRQA